MVEAWLAALVEVSLEEFAEVNYWEAGRGLVEAETDLLLAWIPYLPGNSRGRIVASPGTPACRMVAPSPWRTECRDRRVGNGNGPRIRARRRAANNEDVDVESLQQEPFCAIYFLKKRGWISSTRRLANFRSTSLS